MSLSILNVTQNYDNPEDDLIFKEEVIDVKPIENKEAKQEVKETPKVDIKPPHSEIKPKEKTKKTILD